MAFEIGLPSKFLGSAVDGDGRPLYRVRVASLNGGPVRTSGGYSVLPEHDASILATADTVVVPGVYGTPAMTDGTQPPDLTALLRRTAESARMVSICTGAFVLAAAGLLDGRPATTHWVHAPAFARLFPQVHLEPGVLFVDDGDVLTSAGLSAGLDLCLHVVRGDRGADAATAIARWNVVAPHRDGGQAQYIDRPVPASDDGGLAATRAWALERLDALLTVDVLARHAHMSPRTFARRFVAETGHSPKRWLTAQRIHHARRLLESTDLPVEDVAQRSGFGSAAALRTHFARATATRPTAYRRTYRGRPAAAASRR